MTPSRALLLGLLAVCAVHLSHGDMYDPCADILPIGRGDAFAIGLALIPGANATFLTEYLANDTVGLAKMCDPSFQQELMTNYSQGYGVRISVFNLKVDRLHVLRLPYPDIIFSLIEATPPTMVAIAFRKNVYSPPMYLANGGNDTQIWGAGFVVSLAMLVNYETGVLKNLLWYDMTCNGCGGRKSQLCIHQATGASCATPFINCTCSGQTSNCSYADTQFDKCSTSINTGFTGTDKNSAAMRTGPQIQRLNAYSLVSLYYKAKDSVMSQYNSIYGNIAGQWSETQNDARAQQVDFAGGIGSDARGGTGSTTSPPPAPPPPPTAPPPPPPNPLPPGFGGRRRL